MWGQKSGKLKLQENWKVWDTYLIIYIKYNISLISFKIDFQCVFRPDLLTMSGKNRTDPETMAADRKPAAALPGAFRCFPVLSGAFRCFPALRCRCEQPNSLTWARKGGAQLFMV